MRSPDLDIPRQVPSKRVATERRTDFEEIETGFTATQAMKEALRCVQCFNPPCAIKGCPLSHRIPEWINHIAEGRFREAARIISLRNNLPEACGKLCPQESLCEGNCVVRKIGKPVAIGKLEAFIADLAREKGWFDNQVIEASTGKRVAIVGSGPAGLAAAEELLIRGHAVVLFEKQKIPGGLLIYGIPSFKFSKKRIGEKIQRIQELGGEFRCGIEIGKEISLDDLKPGGKEGFDAVLITIGADVGRSLSIPGSDLKNIHLASDFLIAGNLDSEYIDQPPIDIEVGNTCAVFGGGDTASDCVRTAVRLGYKKVICLYRRTEKEMTGRLEDRKHAVDEGVEYHFLTAPEKFLGDEKVKQVECIKMKLGEKDDSGRARPEKIPGSEFLLDVDTVVLALGYSVNKEWVDTFGIQNEWGQISVNKDLATSMDGVFAAGDVVQGADLIVTAVRDGRAAARGIHKYLEIA